MPRYFQELPGGRQKKVGGKLGGGYRHEPDQGLHWARQQLVEQEMDAEVRESYRGYRTGNGDAEEKGDKE